MAQFRGIIAEVRFIFILLSILSILLANIKKSFPQSSWSSSVSFSVPSLSQSRRSGGSKPFRRGLGRDHRRDRRGRLRHDGLRRVLRDDDDFSRGPGGVLTIRNLLIRARIFKRCYLFADHVVVIVDYYLSTFFHAFS